MSGKGKGKVNRWLMLPPEMDAWLQDLGEDHDLSQNTLIYIILAGVRSLLLADRVIAAGIKHPTGMVMRRKAPKLWVRGKAPLTWMSGPYRLVRKGDRYDRSPGVGWYVSGPQIPECFVAKTSEEAKRTAAALIQNLSTCVDTKSPESSLAVTRSGRAR